MLFPSYLSSFCVLFFFFNDTATTEIYTLSLHDALPICPPSPGSATPHGRGTSRRVNADSTLAFRDVPDRKSTRLNSSHMSISYAVFCLKKKKIKSIRMTSLTTNGPDRHTPATLTPHACG